VDGGGLEVLASLILGTLSGIGIMAALYDHQIGMKWVLSHSHPVVDICDTLKYKLYTTNIVLDVYI